MEKKKSAIWTPAIIIGLISIVYGLVLYFMHQMDNKSLGWIGYLIFIIAVCIACNQYAKSLNGNVTFGNVFGYGFKVSAAVALIMIVWSILMFKVIFPDLQSELMQKQTAEMIKKGMSQDQIDKAMQVINKFFMIFMIGGAILMYAFLGAIASLIGAAVAKKNPQADNPFQQ